MKCNKAQRYTILINYGFKGAVNVMYDYLIVGSGLFGSVFAHEMTKAGKSCLVLERRNHVGGNVYCEEKEGIRIQ